MCIRDRLNTVFKIPLSNTETIGDDSYIKFLSPQEKEAKLRGETIITDDLKGLESNSGVVSIELGIEKPKVSLVFVQENSNVSNQNTFLDEWQKKLLGVLIDRNETTYFIDEKGQSSFLRAVEPRAVDQDCQICRLVGLEKKDGYFGGVFVSVNMSRYLSEAYLHAWSMIRSIGIIWVLGIAAIISVSYTHLTLPTTPYV